MKLKRTGTLAAAGAASATAASTWLLAWALHSLGDSTEWMFGPTLATFVIFNALVWKHMIDRRP